MVSAALLAAVVAFIAAAAPFSKPAGEVQVLMDMEVTAGRTIAVFFNDLTRPPAVATPELGLRRTYSFTFTREDLLYLRLDPTDAAGAIVKLYGVEVIHKGRSVRRWTPADLRQWLGANFVSIDDPLALVLKTTTDDPMITTSERVGLGDNGGLASLGRKALINHPYALLFVLLPLFVLSKREHRGVNLALVAIVLGAVPFITREFHSWVLGREALDKAISRAMFHGTSARGNQLVALLAVGLAVTLSIAATLLSRLNGWSDAPTADVPQEPGFNPNRGWLVVWWLLLALMLAPDLGTIVAGLQSRTYLPNWDQDLLAYWSHAVNQGSLPFRDFWYPYGGQFLFELSWPAGPLARWCVDILLFGTLSTSLWLLARGRRAGALAVVAVVILAERVGLVYTLNRYLLAPNLVLAYLAAAHASRITPRLVTLVAVATALVLVFEPLQVLSAIMAITVIWLLEAWRRRPVSRGLLRATLKTPLLFGSIGFAVLSLTAIAMAWSGQLRGALAFYSDVANTTEYVTLPTPLAGLSWRVLDVSLGVIWWPAAAIAVSLYEWLTARRDSDRLRASALLGVGLIAFAVLQKHLIRPMDLQLTIYPLLGGLLYVLFSPRPIPRTTAIGVGAAIGLLAALVAVHGQFPLIRTTIADAPYRLAGSLRVIFDPTLSAKANRERFAPQRFARYPGERELVTVLDQRAPGPLTLFSLTDAPVLYILTGQKPLWMSDMYDGAPVEEQQRIVEWLRHTRPEFIVFEPSQLQVDTVPTAVRVPLVVGEIIETYIPDTRVGRFEVLRARRPGEAVPVDYWRNELGAALDLGHIPAVIDLTHRQACPVPDPCDEYVVADVPSPNDPGEQTITVHIAQRSVDIQFALEPGRGRYVVPLSRLWMWRAARAQGVRATVDSASVGLGLRMQFVKLAPNPELLY